MILMGRTDSLRRHQRLTFHINQSVTEGELKAIRLVSADSGSVKAAGGQAIDRPIPPETAWLIWASLAFAAVIFGLMGVVHWLGKTKPVPAPEPESNELVSDRQEWSHYPQPEDRRD